MRFEAVRPHILGRLLDAVACAMRNIDSVQLERLPRMADFAKWATAAEGALGLPCSFIQAFTDNRNEADTLSLDSEPIAERLQAFMEDKEEWGGSATDLLTQLSTGLSEAEQKSREWPKRADKLSGRLRRIAPNLRRLGIDVETEARSTDHKRSRLILIRKVVRSSVRSVHKNEVASVAPANNKVAPTLYAQAGATDAADATLQPYSYSGSESVDVTHEDVLSAGVCHSTAHHTYQKQ